MLPVAGLCLRGKMLQGQWCLGGLDVDAQGEGSAWCAVLGLQVAGLCFDRLDAWGPSWKLLCFLVST